MTKEKSNFWKIFWPSLTANFLGSIVGIAILFIFIIALIAGLSSSDDDLNIVKEDTVLHLTLDGGVKEKTNFDFDPLNMSLSGQTGLSDLLYGFEKAKTDDRIKGIFIEIKNTNFGYSTARTIRNAINEFEKSGKFVIAYNSGEYISQKAFYITSAVNDNYAFPTSMMQFTGLGAELSFYKNTLDKLNVEVEVIRGTNNDFKSAVEPYFRTNMSDSSRHQIETYMNGMWNEICSEIAKDTKQNTKELNLIADSLLIRRAEDAVKFNLMKGTMYRDEIINLIAKKSKIEDKNDLNFYSFERYSKNEFKEEQILINEEEPNVAVILAEGEVATGGDGLSSKEICKLFEKARESKSIKTIVFRINSPGGSALASDEIWREVKLTNKTKKVIVSMGDVAASGGYYIAAPAEYIFAEPTTITGSIGVFGMIPYTGKMLENYLGISFDRVQTNKHAVMSTNKKLSPTELGVIQSEVDIIYNQFLERVAKGRGMKKSEVNDIARGRVWTGRDALKIGLVDKIGGLNDAIKYAIKKSAIEEARIVYYPEVKENKFQTLIELINDSEDVDNVNHDISTELLNYYKQLKEIEKRKGIQMRLPYDITFN